MDESFYELSAATVIMNERIMVNSRSCPRQLPTFPIWLDSLEAHPGGFPSDLES